MEELKNCCLFKDVPEAGAILENQVPIQFHKNDVIYDSDHFQRAIGILISGKAVAMPLGESKAVLNRFKPGAVFGIAAVFSEERDYISRIVAASECTVVFIHEAELKLMMAQFPTIMFNMMAFLSDRIRFLNRKLTMLNQNNAAGKVYSYIVTHCNAEGMTDKLNISQMAKDLSLGRTSIYRVFEDLEQDHMIIRKDKQIQVL